VFDAFLRWARYNGARAALFETRELPFWLTGANWLRLMTVERRLAFALQLQGAPGCRIGWEGEAASGWSCACEDFGMDVTKCPSPKGRCPVFRVDDPKYVAQPSGPAFWTGVRFAEVDGTVPRGGVPKYFTEKAFPAGGACRIPPPFKPCPKPGCKTTCNGQEALLAHIAKHKREAPRAV
jgi:hypothetical protein